MAKYYSGNAPGDLLDVPNENVETWLTDPLLIWIFMEVIPLAAACIIVFIALTVLSIGATLLWKTLKLMYERKARFKRKKLIRMKRLRGPKDGSYGSVARSTSVRWESSKESVNVLRKAMQGATRIPGQHYQQNLEYKNWLSQQTHPEDTDATQQQEKGTDNNIAYNQDDDDESAVGILTGTKRRKPQEHHHKKLNYAFKPKKYFWVGRLIKRFKDVQDYRAKSLPPAPEAP